MSFPRDNYTKAEMTNEQRSTSGPVTGDIFMQDYIKDSVMTCSSIMSPVWMTPHHEATATGQLTSTK